MRDDRLRRVNTPCPPVPLTAYELVTVRRMVLSAQRKAERRAARNVELGRPLVGSDANALRAERLAALDATLEQWLQAAWPAVADARRSVRDWRPSEDEEREAREEWLAESRLEGSRARWAEAREES